MHRQILEACMPIAIILIVACGLLNLTIKLSRASWDWRRFKKLHRDQSGGVQSLAMVLTLPFFMGIICMIVQLSQLMIGMMGVHYAAYAGARSASVWVPAHTIAADDDGSFATEETPNHVLSDNLFGYMSYQYDSSTNQIYGVVGPSALPHSTKYQKVWSACVLGVAPFCPSLMTEAETGAQTVSSAWLTQDANDLMGDISLITQAYWMNHIDNVNQATLQKRVSDKIKWAKDNTLVFLEWRDAQQSGGQRHHTRQGPTYNPWDYTRPEYRNEILFEQNEVGWQDPITVHVYHRFGLMPGLGALLRKVQRSWSHDDRHNQGNLISGGTWDAFMDQGSDDNRRLPGVFVIHASATMNNDGLIPIYGEVIDEY
jgi:hypothetical protein